MLVDFWSQSHQPVQLRQHRLIQTYRTSLEMLGKKLVGDRLVVDESRQEVVGVVGRKYKFVANLELIQAANRFFAEQGTFRAIKAVMRNRDMLLVGAHRDNKQRVGDVEFVQGVAVYNSETTRQAVYSPQLVFDNQSKTYAMQGQNSSNRMIHRQKKNFQIFLDELIQGAFRHESVLDMVVAGHRRLSGLPLFNRQTRAPVLQKLSKLLRENDIGARSVEFVIESLRGSDAATQWDVYRGLLLAAQKTALSDRLLRFTAWKMITKGG